MSSQSKETFAFQAEINQLLSLIINAFYSNKDIFLRELISNASDALDKYRYVTLTKGNVSTPEIKLFVDKSSKTLSIQDNGIGMNKDELIKNLGTIAHSGTRSFMESLASGTTDVSLIGQFGVGFYSAYLVAEYVRVTSKKYDDDTTYVWSSNASGSFTIESIESVSDLQNGTRIDLILKEDQLAYLEPDKIKEIVKKHNQYCGFPISLLVEQEVEDSQEDSQEDDKPQEEDGTIEDVDEKEEKENKKELKWEVLNKSSPIWTRKPEEVSEDEYKQFYKSISNDWEDHLAVKHFTVDGSVQFKAILYIPKRAPFDMFSSNTKKPSNIKLYVKKVLITDDSENMLPEFLSFIKGVVDSDDVPLNVSREMLQQNSVMKVIQKNLVKKTLDMIIDLQESEEDYKTFYQNFSKNLKLGVYEDKKNTDKLISCLRFYSSKSNDSESVTLKEYKNRMSSGQKGIYYVTGENLSVAKNSPFIEKLVKKGYEVLYMVDAIDEYMMQSMHEYDGVKMINCAKEGDLLEDIPKEEKENLIKEWEPFCNKVKNILGSKVTKVTISERIENSPCVLVSGAYGWSANMERIMKAQALRNDSYNYMNSQKILEINPNHYIIKSLKEKDDAQLQIKSFVEMLFETVMIDSGFALESPSVFAKKIYKLIENGLSGEIDNEDAEELVNQDDTVEAEEPSLEEID
jgi:molecular chaperone HtpG